MLTILERAWSFEPDHQLLTLLLSAVFLVGCILKSFNALSGLTGPTPTQPPLPVGLRVKHTSHSPLAGPRNLRYLSHRFAARTKLVHEWKVLSVYCDTRVLNKYYLLYCLSWLCLWTCYLIFMNLQVHVGKMEIIIHTYQGHQEDRVRWYVL